MLRQFRRRFRDWVQRESDIQRLQALDDYLLADMGIARQSIPDAVRGHRT